MNAVSIVTHFYRISRVIFPAVLILLGASVIWSGYTYQYNGDELLHTQVAYLILNEALPFRDIFSIYTPIFHWFLLPVVNGIGTSIQTLHALRIEMIVTYVVGLACSYFAVREIFNGRTALVFLALILLDPFTTFAGMQIRPDTLMNTLFSFGLLLVFRSIKEKGNWMIFGSGLILGLSMLTAIKIAPAIIPVSIAFLAMLPRKKRFLFLVGGGIPWVVFIAYFMHKGIRSEMLIQLTIDIKYLSDAILYPTRFGFFYLPDNMYVFGQMGKPLTWAFVWVLPFLAGFGGLVYIRERRPLVRSLIISMALTFGALFIPTTAFIQYYVPSYWFFSVFAAAFFVWILERYPGLMRCALVPISVVLYIPFAWSAMNGNLGRARITTQEADTAIQTYWGKIPETKAVFPGYLFRPNVHPLINGYYMGDIPEVIRKQFELPEVSLEKTKTPYVYLNDAAISTYEPSTQAYIREHYDRVIGDEHLLIRRGLAKE